mmetsp:Transcript_855/g.1651  ORF Transcript_855/g.1651 Transcript_855/m.1651 type:complete len:329 (-) Transcript_855:79-1065(-)|eukprot:CAMPEP_0168745806 /NCGR_PEP_ID=MMETSP0724-20121128/14811_1 /TAXON_ID=265536 /ORGANISM="Amphiprora sp., Strain CCMP467" /LENGTH=328 /DNA_ID=CAMNT_0008793537 /DNA_START=81 /DNA_END=1067 /DNA_ORIENTATION=-
MSTLVKISDLMKPGHTAVVTGASSGIGKAAALAFALHGMNVWMLDIDGVELLEAQKFVKQQVQLQQQETQDGNGGTTDQLILAEKVDVSQPDGLQLVVDQVFSETKGCNILMNNAGIGGASGSAVTTDLDQLQRVLGVNLYGPLHGVRAFVPKMQDSKQPGIIINTGSKQGITMPPGNITYNISKAALNCYTQGLEHELMKDRTENGGQLRAALLVPGWVNTSIMLKSVRNQKVAAGEDFDPNSVFFHEDKPASGAWMPRQVIDFMIQELDAGKFFVICPDNDVDRETDNLRMTWTMQDITQDRPPLSRWHPEYQEEFQAFLDANKKK